MKALLSVLEQAPELKGVPRSAIAEAAAASAQPRAQRLLGLRADGPVATALLQGACRVALAGGELQFEQNLALEDLRERLAVSEDALAAMIDGGVLEALPEVPPELPDSPFDGPWKLVPDAARWAKTKPEVRKDALAAVKRYRPLGFFASATKLDDEGLASAIEAHRHATYGGDVPSMSDWEWLSADRDRVWTVEFTGNDDGPAIGVAAAIKRLAKLSGGLFAPAAVKVKKAKAEVTVTLTLGGKAHSFELAPAPIHFDLNLLPALNALQKKVVFVVGLDEDFHHLTAVAPAVSPKLAKRSLGLYAAKDFREHREWVLSEG